MLNRYSNSSGVLLIVVVSLLAASCAGEVERQQVVQLKKVAAQTPVYPEFRRTGEKIVLKSGMVYFFTYYESSAQFSEVMNFYNGVMAQGGWGPPQRSGSSYFYASDANWVQYRRGEYVFVVEQDERVPNNFDVVVEWDPE